jgi:hypothetical protein
VRERDWAGGSARERVATLDLATVLVKTALLSKHRMREEGVQNITCRCSPARGFTEMSRNRIASRRAR